MSTNVKSASCRSCLLVALVAGAACGGGVLPGGPDSSVTPEPRDATADTAPGSADAALPDAPSDAPSDVEGDSSLLDTSVADASVADTSPPSRCGPHPLRVLAGNLSSGATQTYDPGDGIRILRALAPDVALIQEFKYQGNSAAAQRAFVDAAFGSGYSFVRGTARNNSDIPNGVVSRFPIVDSGEWIDPGVTNRTFVWARIDVPGPEDLWAISVHLLTTNSADRAAEAAVLVGLVGALPAGALVVLGGDLNTNTRTEAAITTLQAAFVTSGPYPADQAGNSNTNAPRNRAYDWVLASPELEPCNVPTTLGMVSLPSGLVFDTRVFTPLTDAPPALVGDSAAASMQHMAVVRDFSLADPL